MMARFASVTYLDGRKALIPPTDIAEVQSDELDATRSIIFFRSNARALYVTESIEQLNELLNA